MIASICRYDQEGRQQGKLEKYYPDGKTHSTRSYKDGVLDGMSASWDAEGNLIGEAWYQNGQLHGKQFQKLPDGRSVVFHYEKNIRNGTHQIFYPVNKENEQVKALEVAFVNGKPDGDAAEYDMNGKLVSITPFKNGVKEGVVQAFGSKGNVLVKVMFQQDKKEGPAFEYYPSGKLLTEADFAADQKHGAEKGYFEDGKLAHQSFYKEGKLHGLSQRWNENGVLVFEGEYKDGLRHGKLNKYSDQGKPTVLQVFENDELQGVKKSFDDKGICTETRWDHGKKVS